MELIINDRKEEEEEEEEEGEEEEEVIVTIVEPPVKIDTCVELKNIQYKTMLLKGGPARIVRSTDTIANLDKFLEDEKNANVLDSWSNLDKTLKMKKLMVYAETYKVENTLSEDEYSLMLKFLKESLDHKKLQRVKDVNYDKTSGLIKSIPALNYNKATSHFTLKNVDKRVSTLKSLPPKKNRGTVKTHAL
jgi:hypothetical protein